MPRPVPSETLIGVVGARRAGPAVEGDIVAAGAAALTDESRLPGVVVDLDGIVELRTRLVVGDDRPVGVGDVTGERAARGGGLGHRGRDQVDAKQHEGGGNEHEQAEYHRLSR